MYNVYGWVVLYIINYFNFHVKNNWRNFAIETADIDYSFKINIPPGSWKKHTWLINNFKTSYFPNGLCAFFRIKTDEYPSSVFIERCIEYENNAFLTIINNDFHAGYYTFN